MLWPRIRFRPLNIPFPWGSGTHLTNLSLNHSSVPAKSHLNPLNGSSRVHECDRRQTDWPRYRETCKSDSATKKTASVQLVFFLQIYRWVCGFKPFWNPPILEGVETQTWRLIIEAIVSVLLPVGRMIWDDKQLVSPISCLRPSASERETASVPWRHIEWRHRLRHASHEVTSSAYLLSCPTDTDTYTYSDQRRRGFRKFGAVILRQPPAIFRQMWLRMLKVLILPLNFSKNWEFPTQHFVFLEENFRQKEFFDRLKFGGGNCPPPYSLSSATTPLK